MTQIKHTVLDVLTMLSDLRGESSVDSSSNRIRAVSWAVDQFANAKFWHYYRIDNKVLTGTSADLEFDSTTFPARVKGVTEVFVDGLNENNRYTIVDYNQYKQLINTDPTGNYCYQYFDQTNDKWKIKFSHSIDGKTVYVTYYFTSPELTATTDAIYGPETAIFAHSANAYLYQGEDEDKYKDSLALAQNLLQGVLETEEQPAINQTYQFAPSTTRGIGAR